MPEDGDRSETPDEDEITRVFSPCLKDDGKPLVFEPECSRSSATKLKPSSQALPHPLPGREADLDDMLFEMIFEPEEYGSEMLSQEQINEWSEIEYHGKNQRRGLPELKSG